MIDEPLYEAFYGLREQPFSLTTDPRFLYLSAAHRQAFDDLLTGLRRREGLLVLTGDTGTGKTTLCRAVIDALGQRTFAALILNPYMSDAEVVRTIVRDFGLVTREDIRKGAFEQADVPQLLDTLETFLRSLLSLNSYAVVIIDEAQSLAPKVLDQIRVLGALEHEGKRLLQIVLVGQPSLMSTLATGSLRALNDRVSRRNVLDALPDEDVAPYIRHRLAIAGGRESVTFDAPAIAKVAELSDGLPRRINLLCDRALELGRHAGTRTITAELIVGAARAIGGTRDVAPAELTPAPPVVVPVSPAAAEPETFVPPAPQLSISTEDLPGSVTPEPVVAPPPVPAAVLTVRAAEPVLEMPMAPLPPTTVLAPAELPDTLELDPVEAPALTGPLFERLDPEPARREREPFEADEFAALDRALPNQQADPEPRMQLLMDAPPKRDLGFWMFLLVMLGLAVLGAGAGYAAFRFGLLRWLGL